MTFALHRLQVAQNEFKKCNSVLNAYEMHRLVTGSTNKTMFSRITAAVQSELHSMILYLTA